MADVFISYARDDQSVARRVARALQAAGFDVWWDADLPAHRDYSEVIERNLEEAKAVVVLWSATAAKSQWVRAEADFARNAGKLVQAQLDATLPPMPFNQIQCAELKGWRGGGSHGGWAKLQSSVQALAQGEDRPAAISKTRFWDRFQPYRSWAAAAVFLVIAALSALLFVYGRTGDNHKLVLAVLPFESLDGRDASLAAGMWEDTRTAIGRNPQLLVLGPNTSGELAKKDSGAARKAADYLLNASIRTAGNRIRISTDLTRTKDGAQVWSQTFDRRLDDVFQLQSEIAREIEGHIRGRLAEAGGMLPQNIATSGEVYALYSDARAKIRAREETKYKPAYAQLEQVVGTDPNFAPGWATLAVLKNLLGSSGEQGATTTAQQDARKAIALAPNLAAAHAALGLTLGRGPGAEAELRHALQLDPNDIEAMNWLAATLDNSRSMEKLALYTKIADVEPLWWPAVLNKLNLLYKIGNMAAVEQELARVEKIGDVPLATTIKLDILTRKGDLSAVVGLALAAYRSNPDPNNLTAQYLWQALMQLGYLDLADKLSPPPSDYIPLIRANDPRALEVIQSRYGAKEFWQHGPLPIIIGRVCLLTHQMSWLAKMYRAAGSTPEQFEQLIGKETMSEVVPSAAIALREAGDSAISLELLQRAEANARDLDRTNPADQVTLARIYAAQGRNDEAIVLLSSAVRAGWLPPYLPIDVDLEHDPPFAELRGDTRFQRLRQQVLATLARERAELGPITLEEGSSKPH